MLGSKTAAHRPFSIARRSAWATSTGRALAGVDHLAAVLAGERAAVVAACEGPARNVTDGAADHVFETLRHPFGGAVACCGCPAIASC